MTAPASILRVLVVDDEPLAIRRLEMALSGMDGVAIAGSAGDGLTAMAEIARLRPDVVLLDIRMPGMDGLALMEALRTAEAPAVIFVTAFSRFAVDAFKLAAVDYLLKPIEFPRLAEALERARASLASKAAVKRLAELQAAVGTLAPESPYARELWITRRGVRHRVPLDTVEWIEAERDYVRLHLSERTHLVRQSMRGLERQLDPAAFARIHRSALVRLDRVTGLGAGIVTLASGGRAPLARRHAAALRARLAGP
jgi:DNA-binding LytR/AlgR family response regulator